MIPKYGLLLQMKEVNQKLSYWNTTFSNPQSTNTSIPIIRCLTNVQNKYAFTFQDLNPWFYTQTMSKLVKYFSVKSFVSL